MNKNLLLPIIAAFFSLTVFGQTNLIQNGSFEYDIAPWTCSSKFWNFGASPCAGSRYMLTGDGNGEAYASLTNEWVQQVVSIPNNSTAATLYFCYKLNTGNAGSGVRLTVKIGSSTLATYYYSDSYNSWKNVSVPISNISSFSGQNVAVQFYANESSSNAYWGKVYVDNVSLNVTYTTCTNSSAPTSVSVNPSSITSGNSSTLTVSGGSLGTGASWKWYSGSCGGTYVGTGNSISVYPSSTTTYYVRAEGTCNTTTCASKTLTVTTPSCTNSSNPSYASAFPSSINSGNSSTLTVSGGSLGTGASWNWYSGNCGGTYVGSGNSITVYPSSTTTYYVRAEGDCNTTTCVYTTLTVSGASCVNSSAPSSVSANPSSIYSGNSTNLTVSGGSLGSGASWQWYSGNCGGTYVGSGNSITVSPGSTTTYYVRAEGNCNTTSCVSMTVNVTPCNASTIATSISASSSSIVSGNSSTLTVSGGSLGTGASWKWYTGSCGGSLIGTGNSISVSPGSATTYYVRAEGTCNTTACVSKVISVTKLPTIQVAINAPQCTIADPIQTGTGTYKYSHKDFSIPTVDGSINFTRYYNSVNNTLNSPMGYGWSHTYNYYIDIQRDALNQTDAVWNLHYPDGHIADFIPLDANPGTYPRLSLALYSGTLDSLAMINSNLFILYTKDNRQYHFSATGQLTQITDLNNNTTTINRSGNNITSIVGQGGRSLTLDYNGSLIASVTEPGGRKCNFTYDPNGNLTNVQDPKGGITKYTYDINHRMISIVNSLGDTFLSNTYDTQGRVIKQTDADNETTILDYDTPSAGKTTITNPDNSQIIATHDQFFRKTNVIDELGLSQSFTYDARSNETSFTNENGVTISRQYDWNGNAKTQTIGSDITSTFIYNTFNAPTQITDPNGKSSTITYDAKNNPTAIQFPDNTHQYFAINSDGTRNRFTDGRNNATTYSYSMTGDMVSATAPNGTKNFGYDVSGRLISVTDENNRQTQISYDKNDNINSITDALARTTEFTYDANNQLLSVKDKNGNLTKFTYDKKGRLKTNTNPKDGITTYAYDVRDNLITISDPKNNTISLVYDKKGRKTSITDALGSSQYQYDGVGNMLKVTDATGKTTEFTYSITNKTKSVTDGLMNSTTYIYDKNDNLINLISAINKSTVYTYDSMNRLITVLDADNKTTTITYDENGNKKSISDPNGHIQTFNYDAANRLTQNIDAEGNSNSYSYDPAGNVLSLVTPTGTISKTYDSANRVLTVTNPGGNNYTFAYDKNDNLISMQNGTGTSSMVYDAFNQLTQYNDPFNKTVTFAYDALGNKTSITYPGNHKVNYTYDAANNLKSVTDWLNQTFTYTYDAAGQNTKLTYPNGIQCDLVFDTAARLTSKKNATSSNAIINSSQFVLDAIGNRTSEQRQGPIPTNLLPTTKNYSYANDDVLKTNGVWNYANDPSGNRTQETKGNKTANYTFSVDNLLKSTIDTLGVTTTFNYDPLGHRLSKSTSSNQSRFVLDLSSGLSQVLQITDGNGVLKAEYVYGLGLLESIDPANKALFYHFDAQHNTVALTNPSSTITDSYTYDPFGTLLSHTGNSSQPFTFLGEFGVEQENASLYFVRARYYDAVNGRFLSKDSFSGELGNPQTLNRFPYGNNNSISNIDPSGLLSWSSLGIATLQTFAAAGQLAETTLELWTLPATSVIGGGSAVLSAADSFNESTKNLQAAGSNFMNFIHSNDNWVDSSEKEGALDVIGFDNKYVKVVRDANVVYSTVKDIGKIVDNVINAPTTLKNIIGSNYTNKQKVGFASKYLFSSVNNNPITSIDDYIDGLKSSYDFFPNLFNAVSKSNNGK